MIKGLTAGTMPVLIVEPVSGAVHSENLLNHKYIYLMKKNMGITDKVIRILISIVIGILYFTHHISGVAGTLLLILAGIFILTSFMGTCPLYLPFGISTKKE